MPQCIVCKKSMITVRPIEECELCGSGYVTAIGQLRRTGFDMNRLIRPLVIDVVNRRSIQARFFKPGLKDEVLVLKFTLLDPAT